ncbi:hypothetical protein LCER1_G000231 [Lachnellula cervina]|uniref:Uncharacterized protein n=1 Tax=Lachnellula cervina TaxID=1316786 RepID=A0A7D8YY73_9HELO|nr:hypothetical protein LCER1_G000231 [Lachnellula cervina]
MFSAKNSKVVISENMRLLPGASIIMAILFDKSASKVDTDETCPMPRCGSTVTTAAPGGGRIWCPLKVNNAMSGLTTRRKSGGSDYLYMVLI